jgi:hypothetical protein
MPVQQPVRANGRRFREVHHEHPRDHSDESAVRTFGRTFADQITTATIQNLLLLRGERHAYSLRGPATKPDSIATTSSAATMMKNGSRLEKRYAFPLWPNATRVATVKTMKLIR